MLPDVSRQEILHMATAGGADVLDLNAGRIMPGKSADLVGFRVASHSSDWLNVPFELERNQADFVMVEGLVVPMNYQPDANK